MKSAERKAFERENNDKGKMKRRKKEIEGKRNVKGKVKEKVKVKVNGFQGHIR